MRTASILEVLATPEALTVVATLLRQSATQSELIAAVEDAGIGHFPQPSASHLLREMKLVGLVDQPRRRGPYKLVAPELVGDLLEAALRLSERHNAIEDELNSAVRHARRNLRLVEDLDEADE